MLSSQARRPPSDATAVAPVTEGGGMSIHRFASSAVAALALCAGTDAFAQTNETRASAYRWMLDPEFLQPDPSDPLGRHSSMATYMDISTGNVYVFSVDPATGAFIPDSGQGTLILANADPVGSLGGADVNGPEWSCGTQGCSTVFTRFIGGTSMATAFIGVGVQGVGNRWSISTLAQPRNGPFGSSDPSNCARISYQDPQGYHYWRCLNNPASEEMFPGLGPSGVTPAVRFVDGPENAAAYPVPVNGVDQVFRYDLDTKAFTQLTFDPTVKSQPWMFHAPEYGNALVLLATASKTELDLFVPQPGADPPYVKTVALAAPAGYQFFSTEPMVYGGNSYALMQLVNQATNIPEGIWLADLNAAHPALVRLTAPQAPTIAEADPEYFLTAHGPIAYYSRFDSTRCVNTPSPWFCPQGLLGLWRVDINLPLPGAAPH
jgi:hypothetical protein